MGQRRVQTYGAHVVGERLDAVAERSRLRWHGNDLQLGRFPIAVHGGAVLSPAHQPTAPLTVAISTALSIALAVKDRRSL